LYVKTAVGLVIVLLMRYALRMVLLHDLRGLRGTPIAKASMRLTLAPSAAGSAA
jgi:hypothetical protein